MPTIFIAFISFFLYAGLVWMVWRKQARNQLRLWPKEATLFRIWLLWLLFLAILTPLTYHEGDMGVWVQAVDNLLQSQPLPDGYVYLPIYAQILAGIVWPISLSGIEATQLIILVVNWFVLAAYALSAGLMVQILPNRSQLAPLGIVLAPVTIFYVVWGTNHVVMFFFLLVGLLLVKRRAWFWAGLVVGLACYKFLLLPTAVVLFIIIFYRKRGAAAAKFVSGGIVSLLPSFLYYYFDQNAFWRVVSNQAAIGAHSHHVEPFHFFYLAAQHAAGFEAWYIGHNVWLILCLLGIPLSLMFYWRGTLNVPQALALSYAFVVLFAPEPFRLEPLIGLLWLDAVFRDDLPMQTAVFAVLFVHAISWFDKANSRFLVFDPAFPAFLWQARGAVLGIVIIAAFVVLLFQKQKRDFMVEGS